MLTRSKFIGKRGKVLIKNKDRTLVTAPRVLCGRRAASRRVSVQHRRVMPHTCVHRERATCPNSVMGTTSADYPPAVLPAGPCCGPRRRGALAWSPHLPPARILQEHRDLERRGRGAISARGPCASRCPGQAGFRGDTGLCRAPAAAGLVIFAPLLWEPRPRCHGGK